jgi:hypothetical protein
MMEEQLPDDELVRELGLLVYRWSGLELMIDGTCAYLWKTRLLPTKLRSPPRSFKERLKYIRSQSKHTALTHLRFDLLAQIDEAAQLSEYRNQLMHAVYLDLSNSTGAKRTIIKLMNDQYVAIQDIQTQVSTVRNLVEDVRICFAKLYNSHDRLKSVIRALEGDQQIGRRARLHDSRRVI